MIVLQPTQMKSFQWIFKQASTGQQVDLSAVRQISQIWAKSQLYWLVLLTLREVGDRWEQVILTCATCSSNPKRSDWEGDKWWLMRAKGKPWKSFQEDITSSSTVWTVGCFVVIVVERTLTQLQIWGFDHHFWLIWLLAKEDVRVLGDDVITK